MELNAYSCDVCGDRRFQDDDPPISTMSKGMSVQIVIGKNKYQICPKCRTKSLDLLIKEALDYERV